MENYMQNTNPAWERIRESALSNKWLAQEAFNLASTAGGYILELVQEDLAERQGSKAQFVIPQQHPSSAEIFILPPEYRAQGMLSKQIQGFIAGQCDAKNITADEQTIFQHARELLPAIWNKAVQVLMEEHASQGALSTHTVGLLRTAPDGSTSEQYATYTVCGIEPIIDENPKYYM